MFRSQIHHLGHLISHLQYLLEVEHSEKAVAAAAVVVVAAVAGQALSELVAAAAAELVVVAVAQGVPLALVL
jgi:hypothetical protein